MRRLDFIISNDRHHTEMFLPVVKTLAAIQTYRCRVVSLCEFRGMISPVEKFRTDRVTFTKILPFRIRGSPSVGIRQGSMYSHATRKIARKTSWQWLLGPRLGSCFKASSDLVVLANDAAFPYDHLCRLLRARAIPFLLVQEGIRFPLPGVTARDAYGMGGATAIAAWGESSAEYFQSQGVPDWVIHRTGNPRFDVILARDWQSEADVVRARYKLGKNTLLFLSNPIDDQGFCSTQQKLELVRRFITGLAPLFNDTNFSLVLKLHSREPGRDYRALIADLPFASRVTILDAVQLYPLLQLAQAAIVFASTAGLEALLFDLPLGILEIPQAGFVHDYVSSGVARGLTWNAPLAEQVDALLQSRLQDRQLVEGFLTRSLAVRAGATQRVCGLIDDLVSH